jgi:hypothetical protein
MDYFSAVSFRFCIFALTSIDPELPPQSGSCKFTNEPPVGHEHSGEPNTFIMWKPHFGVFSCTLILTSCKKDNPVGSLTSNPTSYELASMSYSDTYVGQSFYPGWADTGYYHAN